MSEAPTPPKPPTPPAVGKHLKGKLTGHPKWVYVAGITVLIGVAYIAWQKSRNAATATPVDDGSTYSTPDPNSGFYPDATQGAFGGYSDPGFLDPQSALDPITPDPSGPGALDPNPVVINLGFPAPTTQMAAPVSNPLPMVPTGGGTAPARTVAVHLPPKSGGKVVDSAPPTNMGGCPKSYPNKSEHGCFRREYDPKRKRHYHLYSDGEKVWL